MSPHPTVKRQVAATLIYTVLVATIVVGCADECDDFIYYCYTGGEVPREFTYPREAVAVRTGGDGCDTATYTCDDTPTESECSAKLTPVQPGTCTIEVEFSDRSVSGSVLLRDSESCCPGKEWAEEDFDALIAAGVELY